LSSMASSPLEASPTTSQSSCVSKMLRTPCRTMSWSSTIRIRGTRRSYFRNGLPLNHTNLHVAREYWKSCAFEPAILYARTYRRFSPLLGTLPSPVPAGRFV
jgi:hypothetical protein